MQQNMQPSKAIAGCCSPTFEMLGYTFPVVNKKISEILLLHSGIIVVLSNK